jgi:hypothetical protein
VKIELLKAGAANSVVAAATPSGISGNGSYDWTIPAGQASGSDYKIRITSTSKSVFTDSSDNNFSIVPAGITITAPVGGRWGAGTKQAVRWTYVGNPGPFVKIELLKGGVLSGVITPGADIGSGAGLNGYMWAVPLDQTPGNDYQMRVTSTTNAAISSTGNNFSILASGITVVSPNGNEVYKTGTSNRIWWIYTGDPGPSVKIELLKGGVLNQVIVARTPMGSGVNGTYNWGVPPDLAPGSDYKIRITSVTDGTYTDTSNGNFTVQPGS